MRYYQHIKENDNSLIARIYGVFQIQMESIVPVNLLLMANTIQVVDLHSSVDKLYDLKGSWINRIVRPGENQTKKDRNFLACKYNRLKQDKKGLVQFHPADIKKIMRIIHKDV